MPKGKGMLGKGAISQALQADIESTEGVKPVVKKPVKMPAKDASKKPVKAKKPAEPVGEIERISITIDKAMLRKIDAHVFSQKQNGNSANRSRFITEAIASAVNKL